jgi:hypothetical protein
MRTSANPSNPPRRPRFQVSLGFLLLATVVCAVISAGLVYASKVPAVQEELSVLLGKKVGTTSSGGRWPHLIFILFTFTSPLLLAGVLSTALSVLRWIRRAS